MNDYLVTVDIMLSAESDEAAEEEVLELLGYNFIEGTVVAVERLTFVDLEDLS